MVCQTGALVTRDESSKGTLELGKLDDAVALDDNPLTCGEDAKEDINVSHTFLGGPEVFTPA